MLTQTEQDESAQIKSQFGEGLQALLTDLTVKIENQTLVILCPNEEASDNLLEYYAVFQEDPFLKASTVRGMRHEYGAGSTSLPLNNPNFP